MINSLSSDATTPSIWVVIPAAGVGKRMQADRPKQYLQLSDCTVLEKTLQKLWDSGVFKKVVVSVSTEDEYWSALPVAQQDWVIRAAGGEQRADSVLSGLKALDTNNIQSCWSIAFGLSLQRPSQSLI